MDLILMEANNVSLTLAHDNTWDQLWLYSFAWTWVLMQIQIGRN